MMSSPADPRRPRARTPGLAPGFCNDAERMQSGTQTLSRETDDGMLEAGEDERGMKPGATSFGTVRAEATGSDPPSADAATGAPLEGVDVKLG